MRALATEDQRNGRIQAVQWVGVLAGPVAWIFDEGLSYALVQHACSTGHYYVLHVVSIVCLVIALSGVFLSWKNLLVLPASREEKGEIPGGSPMDRAVFMAKLGLMMSVGFVLVIIALGVPKVMMSPCQ